jgi:hypothetical protein
MIRQATVVLFAAAMLAPAASAGRYSIAAPPPSVASASQAAATCHQYCGLAHHAPTARTPASPVIVRDLVSNSGGGCHWLDAAVGFGFAAIAAAAVLLVVSIVGGRRTRVRPASSAS